MKAKPLRLKRATKLRKKRAPLRSQSIAFSMGFGVALALR